MGLQWFRPSQTRLTDDPDLFSIGGWTLCRVPVGSKTYYGTLGTYGRYNTNPQSCIAFYTPFNNYTTAGKGTFEVAYTPYLNNSGQWRSPEFRWQPVEGDHLPTGAIPVGSDDKGLPRYLCYEHLDTNQIGMRFPGTLSSVQSGCSNHFKVGSREKTQLRVMTHSLQAPDTDNWMLIKGGRIPASYSGNNDNHEDKPCRKANGRQLLMGMLVQQSNGRYLCYTDGDNEDEFKTYELVSSGLAKYRAWQSNREAFYDYTVGALSAGEDYYANPGRQKIFCRINGNQIGAVNLTSDTPVCRVDSSQSSLEFELFSRVLPLPKKVVEQTAPPWQMVIIAEDKKNGKKYYCNGVKVSDWLVATSSECVQERTLEHYNYQLTGVSKRETYSVSKILSGNCHKKTTDSGCQNLVLLVSNSPISGRDNAPLAARVRKKQETIFSLPRSISLISTLKFEPEKSTDSNSVYFSLKQPLVSGREDIELTYFPEVTNYYYMPADNKKAYKSLCPLFKRKHIPGSLLPSKFPDTAFITTAPLWVVTLNNQMQLLGLGVSKDCKYIIPAEHIQSFIQLQTDMEAKLTANKSDIEQRESEPCWLKPHNYNRPDGLYKNGNCLLTDGTRTRSFYLLETSPDHKYQWTNAGNAQQRPNSSSTFGYSPEGYPVVLAKNNHSSKFKSEDQLQAGDQVLTSMKRSMVDSFGSPYDREEWHHCPDDQWPCADSLSFKVKSGREGWCRGRFNFEWVTGRYRDSCQVQLPDKTTRTGNFYSEVMMKPRFYRRYDVEPVWSHKPDRALMSSLFRMKPDKDAQKAAYLCHQGTGSTKHHNNKNMCKQVLGDSFSDNDVVIERLLKHYPPDESHYPKWKLVADGKKFSSPGARDDWWYNDGGYLCLKVDAVENTLYLGHVFPEDAGYCKQSRDERSKSYPKKRRRWRDYMVLKNAHYEWRPGTSEQIPETAVIAQRHPQKGNASEFVCRSKSSYQPGKTSLDQKHCLIGIREQKETNFDVLVLIPPTQPPTTITTTTDRTTSTQPTISTTTTDRTTISTTITDRTTFTPPGINTATTGNSTTSTQPAITNSTTSTKTSEPIKNPDATGNQTEHKEWSGPAKGLMILTAGIYIAIITGIVLIVREIKRHHWL